ncbi:hypothetical protein [Bacillus thuringiensis]|uniref:hypothetical protein n=1 Tax=Bacillus thuringiensis TaxID=1428 RepID=UPI000BFE3FA6|nr:hypothetical protein [Bacillus thuringiensis]PGT89914.1 hypothetical protein COD17_09190 [Bacillus thuringiensis]
MGIDSVVAFTNAQITESDLYPITKENVDYFINELGYKGLETYEEIIEKLQATGLPVSNFHMTNKVMSTFVYYDYPVCIDLIYQLNSFPNPVGDELSLGDYIRKMQGYIMDEYEKQDFFGVLHSTHKNCIFMLMNKMYLEVKEEDRFQFFLDNYTHYDYGHSVLSKELVQDAFRCQTPAQRKEMLDELNDKVGKANVVTVYRGQSDKSTHYTESISWTLSEEVAHKFAKRHGFDGEVYKGSVHKKDIMAYYNGRSEEEVLVKPSEVKDVTSMNQVTMTEDFEVLTAEKYIEEYSLYRGTYILEEYFHNFNGIHGGNHCSRVLLHCLSMAREMKLSNDDRAILCLSACLHDIGRENDDEDEMHGIRSAECIGEHDISVFGINAVNSEREYDLAYLDEDEEDILYFIIENHCISDRQAKENLEQQDWDEDKQAHAWRLFEIFKDADGLDRVRLGDLDSNYLRTPAGKRRVFIAHSLFKVVNKRMGKQ